MLRLAGPVVLVQVGMMLMGVVDTIMVGHLSAEALAAVALGNQYLWGVSMFFMGLLMSLDPVMAQAVGARDQEGMARAVQRGLVLCLLTSGAAVLVMVPVRGVLAGLQQPEELVSGAGVYVWICMAGMLPFFAFVVLRSALQGMDTVRPIVWAVVVANGANGLANWVLIYGKLGMPAMGVAGSAWATVVCRWVMAGMLAGLSWGTLRGLVRPWRREATAIGPLKRMLKIGLPIGAHMSAEHGAFALVAILMGALGVTQLAAHQMALNLAALTFMVPLGISQAAAVRVGQAIGEGDASKARRAAAGALALGATFMTGTAVLFVSIPAELARMFTDDVPAVALAALLIPIAGLFQVFDGLQTVATGVLRGVGDTRGPMVINLLGLWLIGTPVGIELAFGRGIGAVGLWWGFVAGLAAVAMMLVGRVMMRMRGPMERIMVDESRF